MTVLCLKTATVVTFLWCNVFLLPAMGKEFDRDSKHTPEELKKLREARIQFAKDKIAKNGNKTRLNPFKKELKPVKGMKPLFPDLGKKQQPPPISTASKKDLDALEGLFVGAGGGATATTRTRLSRKEAIAKRKDAMQNMNREELKSFVDATNLKKRKQKGIFRKRETNLAQILFPGVAPEEYQLHEPLKIMVDLVDSGKTNLPFEYYKLPVCPEEEDEPSGIRGMFKRRRVRKNLGEKLMGKNVAKESRYDLKMGDPVSCTTVCDIVLSTSEIDRLKKLIRRQYAINLSLDGLPVYMYDTNGNAFRGTPLGSKLRDESTGEVQFFYHNHFRFTVLYNVDEAYEGSHRVVGFRVKPISIKHSDDKRTCANEKIINHKDTLLELKADQTSRGLKVTHSYEVTWEETDKPWADRWDVYLRGRPDESLAHHMSIINSFMVVVFLGSVLMVILIKALRKDIAVYNDLSGDGDEEDETGWKLVHGDVFRPPSTSPMLLSIFIGTGMQIFVAVVCTLLLGLTNFLNPMQKGQALSNMVLLYVFSGTVSGYVSSRLFKYCGGKNWKLNTVYTAGAFPGIMVLIFLLLNIFLTLYGSAMAVSIWTIIAVFLLWTCISTPLVCIGSYIGYKADVITTPTRTNQIARVVPKQQSILGSPLTSFIIGGMPFSTVCIEVYFIMGAVWMHQYYYLMGYLFGGCVLLALTCALLSTVLCYMRLCAEDHRWWWKSFFDSATAGFWLFMYSVWYLCTKLGLVGFLPVTVYLTYMVMASVAFGLFCGSIGFMTAFFFTRTIYSAVKID